MVFGLCFSRTDQNRLLNELCNLVKFPHSVEEVKNAQRSLRVYFDLSGMAAMELTDLTCAGLYAVVLTLASEYLLPSSHILVYGSDVECELCHMRTTTVHSLALLCL